MMSHLPASERAAPLELSRARPLLGTLVQIRASGPATVIQGAIDDAFARIESLHRRLSYQDPGSELSLLNRQRMFEPRQVHADTYAVLFAAIHFARLSDGAFDPCIAGKLESWGLLPTHAPRYRRGRAAGGSWRDIELLPDRQVCLRRGVQLDLGGIAKGYAVDQAVELLRKAGATQVMVNAGGDLRCHGPRAEEIWLRHPASPERATHPIRLQDAALATSATYYSRQAGPHGEVSALVDPVNQRPHLAGGSVSVRASSCLCADALTKVVLFADAPVAERALASCDAVAFVQQPEAPMLRTPLSSALRGELAAHAR